MTNDLRSRLRSRAAEGLTIIVSILLALMADAAWDYRVDRADERQLLDGLREEFSEAASEVTNDLAARAEILQQTDALLAARRDASLRPAADSVPQAFEHVLDWRFYTPVHAVLDDAITSGRLDLIRSDDVREALMAYLLARDRLPVFEGLERDFVTSTLEPFLAQRVALDGLVGVASPETRERQGVRFLALLDDDEFGSLLHIRRQRTDEARIYARLVQRAIERVQGALTEEQGAG